MGDRKVWIRARFYYNADDPRPVTFPPPGPYWISGHTVGHDFNVEQAIVVAYLESEEQILQYWPDAENIEADEVDELNFSSRFPKPDWWKA